MQLDCHPESFARNIIAGWILLPSAWLDDNPQRLLNDVAWNWRHGEVATPWLLKCGKDLPTRPTSVSWELPQGSLRPSHHLKIHQKLSPFPWTVTLLSHLIWRQLIVVSDVTNTDSDLNVFIKVQCHNIELKAWCSTEVTPLLTHWSYHSLAPSHQNNAHEVLI